MTGPHEITDETLTAFLDGELDAADAQAVRDAVEANAALRAHLDALKIDRGAVKSAFKNVLPALDEMPDFSDAGKTPALWWRMTAMLLAGVALGFLLRGGGPAGTELEDWRDYAAAYHRLYVTDTLTTAEGQSDNFGALQAALGTSLPEELLRIDGLTFKRGQVLGLNGTAIVQLAYLTEDGRPVAICLTRSSAEPEGQVVQVRQGVGSVSGRQGELDYLVLADLDEAALGKIAKQTASVL